MLKAKVMTTVLMMTAGAAWGQIQEPVGCRDLPNGTVPVCNVTFPNGLKLSTLANGMSWATIHPGKDDSVSVQVTRGWPYSDAFRSAVVWNLQTDIVHDGVTTAQSTITNIEGDCQSKTYVIDAVGEYSGKMGTGSATNSFYSGLSPGEFESVVRKVLPGGPMEIAFKLLCK